MFYLMRNNMQYFITGVDTDIGKTFVTKGLALAFEKNGNKAKQMNVVSEDIFVDNNNSNKSDSL